jgi:hypothetical protein
MKKFIVLSPAYNERNGGAIVLHKLCSILNELGRECYLYPHYRIGENHKKYIFKSILKDLKVLLLPWKTRYKTNPAFNTPVYKNKFNSSSNDWVIIYPEIISGNPLGAKNVVRWLLHQPGFHTGDIKYGKNELYFKFNKAINDFSFPGSTTSINYLKVVHYPLEHYNTRSLPKNKTGTAYCLRKGIHKPIQHDIRNSILIDGKSHKEVASILKRVKTFISYDTYTAYSIFAVLCGCDSIVIPDEDVDEEEWYPDPADRSGLSYGFSKLDESRKTAHLVKQHVIDEEKKSVKNVMSFIEEVETFFK